MVVCTHHNHAHRSKYLVLEASVKMLYGELARDSIEHLSNGFAMAHHLIFGFGDPVLQILLLMDFASIEDSNEPGISERSKWRKAAPRSGLCEALQA